MGTRSLAVVTLVLALVGTAHADQKSDIQKQGREAMEAYDLMDYDAAKKSLNQALAAARKAKLDKDPLTAKIYLYLGVTSFASGDQDGAKAAFAAAIAIDPKIQIDPAYKSPELTKLLETVKSGGTGGTSAEPGLPTDSGPDCLSVKGLEHTILDTGTLGAPRAIEALVGSDISPVKVSVMYRTEGTTEFVESKLSKQGDCKYTGAIPAAAMKGSLIHYYVAAYDGNNKVISGKGSSGSPNIMELAVGKTGPAPNDNEDPINKTKGGGDTMDAVSGGVIVGGKAPKVYIAIAAGTGFGYVTGDTESGNMVQNCCIGSSLVVLTPELGYYINRKLSIGIAGRIGLPIGANVEGHATVAPGALLRLRYSLSATGEGVRVMGQLGGGILRNTIKLDNAEDGMDTDIVAQGPLLIGGGIGYMKRLGAKLAFVADLSAVAGIAVVDKLGTSTLNNGVSADLSLGFALGF
ncbi:MAG: hypothetical protein WKG01_04545 [Kofleriaceae bacterium]